MRDRHGRAPSLLMAGLAVGIFATTLAVPAPAQAEAASTNQIYQTLGVDEVAADYVVLVDTSGSMQDGNLYGAVKDSLRGLFAALAPQDQVTVVTFADGATQVWQGPAGRSPDDIVGKLPQVADGAHTDIGLAMEAAVEVLKRPNAPSIGTAILLTDGKHQPKVGSPYPLEEGYGWDQLTKAAADIHKDALSAYAIPLAGTTSAQLLQKVFGNRASVLQAATVNDLTNRLEQPKRAVRAAKARGLLGNDLSRGVTVSWPPTGRRLSAGTSNLTVTLRSTTTRIPLDISNLAVTTCGSDVKAHVDSRAITLKPGGTASVPVTLEWNAGPSDWRPLHTEARSCALNLTTRVESPWSGFISGELGGGFTPTLSGGQATRSFAAERGSSGWWATGLAVVLLLVALGLALRWHRLHPVLTGILTATPLSSAESLGSVVLRGRRMTISAAALGVSGTGWVRGTRSGIRSAETNLEIAYSRDGSTAAREVRPCGRGGSTAVSGVHFEWRTGSDRTA